MPTPNIKSGPWILYDTVAAYSFLLGDKSNRGLAVGSRNPAISAAGEMTFFKERDKDQNPWYTNLDIPGVLSYGMKVWQAYLMVKFPTRDGMQYNMDDGPATPPPYPSYQCGPAAKLAEAIVHFAVLELGLGQEEQTFWTTHRFGAGGGLWTPGAGVSGGQQQQNAAPSVINVLKFPEPIDMPRTQNFGIKIKIAPEAHGIIGTVANPGVGVPLGPYHFLYRDWWNETPSEYEVDLPQLPYAVEFGLVGERFKDVQYGQTVTEAAAG